MRGRREQRNVYANSVSILIRTLMRHPHFGQAYVTENRSFELAYGGESGVDVPPFVGMLLKFALPSR